MKYIVVTGGIISGIGKGITASSIGLILQDAGYKVTALKIDPYLNVDAGTMSPFEHGECYVLGDGSECDLDLGNYERFLDIELTKHHNITSGQIYQTVINKERHGKYLGKTVQTIPHITDEIISRIGMIPDTYDICIIEIGGTIGDWEVGPFIEAIRQIQDPKTFCFVHVVMAIIQDLEVKTKPCQHSVSALRKLGINPDILVVRVPSTNMLSQENITKLETFCHVKTIISNTNVPNIYFVPELFLQQGIYQAVSLKLSLQNPEVQLNPVYYDILNHYSDPTLPQLSVGIIGKYVGMNDTYLSLIRAIEHASFHIKKKAHISWLDSDSTHPEELSKLSHIIIPGGFGSRGIDGKLKVLEYARTNKIPTLGICLGMQLMVIECWNSSWSVFESPGHSTEFDPDTPIKLVDIIDQTSTETMGHTMRLGNYECNITSNKISMLYGTNKIIERHRHRYEVNNVYAPELSKLGLHVVGYDNTSHLPEIVELEDHPFYIGCQYHPELKSRYNKPHPLFVGLLNSNRG